LAAKRSLSVSNLDSNAENNAIDVKKPTRGVYQPPTGKYSTTNSQESVENGHAKRRTFSHGDRGRGGRRSRGQRHF